MRALPFFIFSTITFILFAFSSKSFAGTVTKSTKNSVIIDFKGDNPPAASDRFYILDQSSQKEIGIVQIVKTKGDRALAKILKGKAKPGDTTDLAKKGPSQAKNNRSNEEREPAETTNANRTRSPSDRRRASAMSFGIGASYVFTSKFITNSLGEGAVQGSSFGFRVAADIPFSASKNLGVLVSTGLHPLVAKTSVEEYTYDEKTNYLAFEGILRLSLERPKEGLWIGGGAGYYMYMSHEIRNTDTTNPAKPGSEFNLIGSSGFNIRMGKSYAMLKGDVILMKNNSFQIMAGGMYFF